MMIPVRLMTAFAVNYTMYVVAYALSGTFTLYIYLVSFVLSEYKNMSLQTWAHLAISQQWYRVTIKILIKQGSLEDCSNNAFNEVKRFLLMQA